MTLYIVTLITVSPDDPGEELLLYRHVAAATPAKAVAAATAEVEAAENYPDEWILRRRKLPGEYHGEMPF